MVGSNEPSFSGRWGHDMFGGTEHTENDKPQKRAKDMTSYLHESMKKRGFEMD